MVFIGILALTVIMSSIAIIRRIMGFYKGLPDVIIPILCAGLAFAVVIPAALADGNLPADEEVVGRTGSYEVIRYSNWVITPYPVLGVENVG